MLSSTRRWLIWKQSWKFLVISWVQQTKQWIVAHIEFFLSSLSYSLWLPLSYSFTQCSQIYPAQSWSTTWDLHVHSSNSEQVDGFTDHGSDITDHILTRGLTSPNAYRPGTNHLYRPHTDRSTCSHAKCDIFQVTMTPEPRWSSYMKQELRSLMLSTWSTMMYTVSCAQLQWGRNVTRKWTDAEWLYWPVTTCCWLLQSLVLLHILWTNQKVIWWDYRV